MTDYDILGKPINYSKNPISRMYGTPSARTRKRGRKRSRISEKDIAKKIAGNRCLICGKSPKEVGKLQEAHIKAQTAGGIRVILLCKNHHGMYDDGTLSSKQLRKLHINKEEYKRLVSILKRRRSKRVPNEPPDPYDVGLRNIRFGV